MMIAIKDCYGHTLLEIDEKRFPLQMPVLTIRGEKEYAIHLNYAKDEENKPTDKIKSVNMR